MKFHRFMQFAFNAVLVLCLFGCGAGGFARAPLDDRAQASRVSEANDEAYAQGVLGATLQQTVDAANRVRDAMKEAADEATKQSAAAVARGDVAEAQAQAQAASQAQAVVENIDNYSRQYIRYKPVESPEESPQVDVAGSVTSAAAALLPPPWNGLALLAIAGWGVWERQRGRGAARVIINSIDAGRAQPNSPLREAMSHAATKEAMHRELSRSTLARELLKDERLD